MFRPMRRKDREIQHEEMLKVILEGEYGFLATIGEDGYPYTVPLNYTFYENAIYFHCALEGHKLDNITYNPKVSFSVVGGTQVLAEQFSTNFESVVLFGTASVVEGDEKFQALTALIDKYSPNYKTEGMAYIHRAADHTAVVKIRVEQMTGKARRD